MRKTLLATAAALAVAAVAGAALANDPPAGAPDGPRGHAERLFQADSNHDGVLTRQEFDAGHAAIFAEKDANHDGALARNEMRGMRGDHHRGGGRHHGGFGPPDDANNDGNISREEFLAGPIAMFERLDANHDGVIQASEQPQRPEHGDRGDRGDHRERGDRRADFDADHNGQVSQAEFAAAGTLMFDRLDANHDGRITREEADAPPPHRGPPGRQPG